MLTDQFTYVTLVETNKVAGDSIDVYGPDGQLVKGTVLKKCALPNGQGITLTIKLDTAIEIHVPQGALSMGTKPTVRVIT